MIKWCLGCLSKTIQTFGFIDNTLGCPAPSNSHHQDYYIFSRGSLSTFICHSYWEGGQPKQYPNPSELQDTSPASASRTASAVAASLAMASSVALRASANSCVQPDRWFFGTEKIYTRKSTLDTKNDGPARKCIKPASNMASFWVSYIYIYIIFFFCHASHAVAAHQNKMLRRLAELILFVRGPLQGWHGSAICRYCIQTV